MLHVIHSAEIVGIHDRISCFQVACFFSNFACLGLLKDTVWLPPHFLLISVVSSGYYILVRIVFLSLIRICTQKA